MALLLMIFKTEKTKKEIDIRIKELTYINEISMTIRIICLIGWNFFRRYLGK